MDLDNLINELKEGKILPEKDISNLCEKAKEILVEESNVQPVSAPVTICGNVTGHFFDLLQIFQIAGEVPHTNYIFLGGMVNRGYHSIQTFSLLLCLKLKYPGHITLLRGSHESRQVSQIYGLHDEIMRNYGNPNVWTYFTDLFDYLPLTAIVEGEILCIHGGLSPKLKTLDQIRTIDRVVEIPYEGPMCDLIWSDPEDIDRWMVPPKANGWIFGRMVTKEFNYINKVNLIARSHQVVQEGYKYWFPRENLLTVWSAPNYAQRCGNRAAIVNVKENIEHELKIFDPSPENSKIIISEIRNQCPTFLCK